MSEKLLSNFWSQCPEVTLQLNIRTIVMGSFSEKSQIRTDPFFILFFKKKETNKWAFLQHQ